MIGPTAGRPLSEAERAQRPPTWLLAILACPTCGGPLIFEADPRDPAQGLLRHPDGACAEIYPVIDGIPRVLSGRGRSALVRARSAWFASDPVRAAVARDWGDADDDDPVVNAFDFEWSRHSSVGTVELAEIGRRYFDLMGEEDFRPDRIVLDAGCGAGRWAFEVASRGPRVVAVDLGQSVEIAARNTKRTGKVACLQADLAHLPLRPGSFDWVYSLGVLHHIDRTQDALGGLVRVVRPGGAVLVYLYYALDQRGRFYRAIFRAVDLGRRITSRLPRPVVSAIAHLMAVTIYWPLARTSRVLHRLGMGKIADAIPLAFYRDRSLRTMINDSLDRFGTRVEKRFSRAEVASLMTRVGLASISFGDGPPYWRAVGHRDRTVVPNEG